MMLSQEAHSRFNEACSAVIGTDREKNGIGTLGEKTLHAVLKRYYEPDTSKHEIRIGNFYADIACGDCIIEIQTGSFYALRKKLDLFLITHKVTVVYPIPAVKYVCWLDPQSGELVSRKRSPKKGSVYDSIPQLFYIRDMLSDPKLELKLLFLELDEYKLLDGWGKNRKNNATKYERIPLAIVDEVSLSDVRDYMMLLPPSLSDVFTPHDLSHETKLNLRAAYAAVKTFAEIGIIEPCGKLNKRAAYRIKEY